MRKRLLILLVLLALGLAMPASANAAPQPFRAIAHGLTDWRLWPVWGVQIALGAWDAHLTNVCQHRYPTRCVETTPGLGSHPSPARVWWTGAAWETGFILLEAGIDGVHKNRDLLPGALTIAAFPITYSALAVHRNQQILHSLFCETSGACQ